MFRLPAMLETDFSKNARITFSGMITSANFGYTSGSSLSLLTYHQETASSTMVLPQIHTTFAPVGCPKVDMMRNVSFVVIISWMRS